MWTRSISYIASFTWLYHANKLNSYGSTLFHIALKELNRVLYLRYFCKLNSHIFLYFHLFTTSVCPFTWWLFLIIHTTYLKYVSSTITYFTTSNSIRVLACVCRELVNRLSTFIFRNGVVLGLIPLWHQPIYYLMTMAR